MKKTGKALLSILLTLLLAALPLAGLSAGAAETPAIIASGVFGDGDSLNWTLTDDGTLTIGGTGAIPGYVNAKTPWGEWIRLHAIEIAGIDPNVDSWYTVLENGLDFDSYYEAIVWRRSAVKNIVIEEGVTAVGYDSFSSCEFAETLSLPSTVKSIGARAFSDMNLSEIHFAEGLESIGMAAFAYNPISEITLPASLLEVGERAFYDCYQLTSVTVLNPTLDLSELTLPYVSDAYPFEAPTDENRAISLYELYTVASRWAEIVEEDIPYYMDEFGWTEEKARSYGTDVLLEQVLQNCVYEYGMQVDEVSFDGLASVLLAAINQELGTAFTPEDEILAEGDGCSEAFAGAYAAKFGAQPGAVDGFISCQTAEEDHGDLRIAPWFRLNVPCTAADRIAALEAANIPYALIHEAEDRAQQAATATAHGFTAGEYCPNCDTWVSGHEVIHNTLGARTVLTQPTEESEGEAIIVCTVCGESGLYAIEKLPQTEQPEDGGEENLTVFGRIQRAIQSFVNWMLRLIRWLGGNR